MLKHGAILTVKKQNIMDEITNKQISISIQNAVDVIMDKLNPTYTNARLIIGELNEVKDEIKKLQRQISTLQSKINCPS